MVACWLSIWAIAACDVVERFWRSSRFRDHWRGHRFLARYPMCTGDSFGLAGTCAARLFHPHGYRAPGVRIAPRLVAGGAGRDRFPGGVVQRRCERRVKAWRTSRQAMTAKTTNQRVPSFKASSCHSQRMPWPKPPPCWVNRLTTCSAVSALAQSRCNSQM